MVKMSPYQNLAVSLQRGFGLVPQVSPAPPAIALNGGPYCQGEMVHLYSEGDYSLHYEWILQGGFVTIIKNPKVSPGVGGDYILKVTDDNECGRMDTTTVCVNQISARCHSEHVIFLDASGEATVVPEALDAG